MKTSASILVMLFLAIFIYSCEHCDDEDYTNEKESSLHKTDSIKKINPN